MSELCAEIGTLIYFWWEYKLIYPVWEPFFIFKNRPFVTPLCHCWAYMREECIITQDTCTSMWTAAPFTRVKKSWPRSPWTDEQMMKRGYMCNTGCYSDVRKMKLAGKWGPRKYNIMYSLTCLSQPRKYSVRSSECGRGLRHRKEKEEEWWEEMRKSGCSKGSMSCEKCYKQHCFSTFKFTSVFFLICSW